MLFERHGVRTVGEMGWSGGKNGQLLQRAAIEFDCFLTVDRNLEFQQRIDALANVVPAKAVAIAARIEDRRRPANR